MLWLIIVVVGLCAFTVLKLRGEDLSYLDQPLPAPSAESPSEAHIGILNYLREFQQKNSGLRGRDRLDTLRTQMDALSDGRNLVCEFRPIQGIVRGEWVLAPDADPGRRLLYIHGGAFMAGSPKSHRSITNRLALDTGCTVFSLDYRLMPEHLRREGIEDCHEAYRWLLENAPEAQTAAEFVAVAGDSAGGNLTLELIAWVRDEGLRQADAAIAFSPATDATLTAPSFKTNQATDHMLGPAFGHLNRVPRPLLWWFSWFTTRIPPSDPSVSPVRGNLAGLPPVLIQVSEAEMLLDDARRYAARARAAGSPVELQCRPHMVHVWQIFTPELPEAEAAFEQVSAFLRCNGLEQSEASAA